MNYKDIVMTPIRTLKDCINLCELMKALVIQGQAISEIHSFLDGFQWR
jgi:hypothetical protein